MGRGAGGGGRGDYGGGGGRGYGGGGRGGYGGGGGGSYGNAPMSRFKHMGEIPSVIGLVRNRNDELLEVLNPPMEKRRREHLVAESGEALPAHSEWRMMPYAGKFLDSISQVVRSNHFQVSTDKMPEAISHYHVSIHKYGKDGLGDKDIAVENEPHINFSVMKALRERHPEWMRTPDGQIIGLTYDGRSAAFSSVPLDFSHRSSVECPSHGTGSRRGSPKSDVSNSPEIGGSRMDDEEGSTDEEHLASKGIFEEDVFIDGNQKFRVTLLEASTITLPPKEEEGTCTGRLLQYLVLR